MIARLWGTLRSKEPHRLVVDVGGVGYLVAIPFSTLYALGEEGSQVDLFIHTHVRDDAIALFGFATAREKEVFEELVSVNGIGPKLATTILSGMSAEDLVDAIREEDRRRLLAIPGLGKKTVERILLELRDRFVKKTFAAPDSKTRARDDIGDDVISALLNLGFKKAEAERAVARVRPRGGEGESLEVVLKAALKTLTG